MNLVTWVYIRFKLFLCRFILLCEFCGKCGKHQPLVWTADDDLWNELNGGPNGVLCPECFDKEADRRGIFLRWKPHVEFRTPAVTPTPAAPEQT